jgi:hypothetical protein
MNLIQRYLNRPFFIRLSNWEYWSFNAIYIPVYIVWIGLSLLARSFFFFAAANPRIKNGGFLNESKKDIFPMIPDGLQPRTIFFSIPSNADIVLEELHRQGLHFPMIGKPDIGGRGRGVKLLKGETDLRDYVRKATLDFHIQEFVSYKNETGIFYYRYPDQETGSISGIVRKEFLKARGDGIRTVKNLLLDNKRAILQLKVLEKSEDKLLDLVLKEGEEIVLVPYGNHARGAAFFDDSHLIDEGLTRRIDQLCRSIPAFYFGRLDIRYEDWEGLKLGLNFSVIEVNGAGSEPTHIYDPGHSIFFAWKEIIRHWFILWKISRINHRRGFPYLTSKEGIQMFRDDKLISKKLVAMNS